MSTDLRSLIVCISFVEKKHVILVCLFVCLLLFKVSVSSDSVGVSFFAPSCVIILLSFPHSRGVLVKFRFWRLSYKVQLWALQSCSLIMFSWGEEYWRSFRLKNGPAVAAGDGVKLLNVTFNVADLSTGHRVLAFIKDSGEAFIIRTNESKDGGRERGKYSKHQSGAPADLPFCLPLIWSHLSVCRVREMSGENWSCELRWGCGHTAVWERLSPVCRHNSHSLHPQVSWNSQSFLSLKTSQKKTTFQHLFCHFSSPKALSNIQVTQVACGNQHTVVLTKGTVNYCGRDRCERQ